jgi:DMSO/TMAO reductase YedYZ heme-binding membrane subunit
MNPRELVHNIRFYILLLTFSFSVGVFLWVQTYIPRGPLQNIRLTQIYAFSALTCLYLALLAGPFVYQMRWFPWRSQYIKARRAIGVSAFYFAWLHAYLGFFKQLGGFAGLPFLNSSYLIAISLSFTALMILTAMAATSFDKIVTFLSFPKWKMLHRLVYLAGIFIIIHALMLGTHFQDLTQTIPRITFILLSFLFYLEAKRIDAFIERKWNVLTQYGLITILYAFLVGSFGVLYMLPQSAKENLSFGIHSQHIQIAKEVQNNPNATLPSGVPSFPGMQGDRTKRFSVSFNPPQSVVPLKDTSLAFQIFDAGSGNRVFLFQTVYEKPMHLIIVSENFTYFEHIHPTQKENEFSITTQFPENGTYHIYTDFQPFGAIEQQFAFTLKVGDGESPLPNIEQETTSTKTFGEYRITLDHPKPLLASKLSIGEQILKFTLKDATGNPVTNLKPYLSAFGHLVMIDIKTFDYLHVHPNRLTPVMSDETGGPVVEFMPLGLYGPIKPGMYKLFAQFNPGGNLFTSDFVVEVE